MNLSELQEIEAFFAIDENGNLSAMKIRDVEVIIQAEVGRVFKKIPKMKPATQDGVNVAVLCSVSIKYGSEILIELVYIPANPTKKSDAK